MNVICYYEVVIKHFSHVYLSLLYSQKLISLIRYLFQMGMLFISESERVLISMKVYTDKEFTVAGGCVNSTYWGKS